MSDPNQHDVRNDFQFISDYIKTKTVKEGERPTHEQFTSEQAALAHAGLHVGFMFVVAVARIADALEQIAMNTRKDGMLQ